jgi:hypothetical protein
MPIRTRQAPPTHVQTAWPATGGVEGLHGQEVQRHAALPARLCPRPVRVVAAHHVQVRPRHLTAQRTRVGEQVHIAAAQPAHLAAAQPGPGHQQHDQPVARRAAGPQQCDDVGVTGPVDRTLGLVQPMPGPHPPRHPPVTVAGGLGQVPVLGDLIQQRQQMPTGLTRADRVHHHAAHRRQHPVDPSGPARWDSPRPDQHHRRTRTDARGRRTGVGQPRHEQRQLFRTFLPGAARAGAPPQEQRDRAGVALRRRLRAVAAEAHVPQETIRNSHDGQVLVQHRPVRRAGRQTHRERPHLGFLLISWWVDENNYQPRAPHPRRPAAEPRRTTVHATSRNR